MNVAFHWSVRTSMRRFTSFTPVALSPSGVPSSSVALPQARVSWRLAPRPIQTLASGLTMWLPEVAIQPDASAVESDSRLSSSKREGRNQCRQFIGLFPGSGATGNWQSLDVEREYIQGIARPFSEGV